jgi:hypothetical protein
MAELARLRIAVDSTSAKTAERDLEGLASAAGNTGRAVDAMVASQKRMADAMQTAHKPTLDAVRYLDSLNRELETVGKSSLQIKALEIKLAAAAAPTAELSREIRNMGAELLRAERNAQTITPHIGGVGNSSKLASHHAQNLAFQLQDVGVSLISGQNPMMVFAQQGTQIAGIMGQAGLSVRGLAVEIAAMTGRVAAAVAMNPYFLAFAAAAGTAFVAFKDFQAEVGKTGELEKFQASLGLTRKELKELEKEVGPAAITMGDVFKGLGKTISDALNLGPAFDAFKEGFFATFRFVAELGSDVAAGIYAAFVGTYQGIIETYKMLPAAMGDVLTQAVNGMSRGLETFLNGFIASTNTILGKFQLPKIDLVVDIPELQNRYAGAANAAGTAFTGQIKQAFSDAKAGFSAAGDTLSANIIDAAKQRMQGGADTILDERTLKAAAEKGGKTLGEYIAIETGQAVTALEKSFKFDDSIMQGAGKRLQEMAEIGSTAFRSSMEKNLNTFSDVLGGIGDLFGQKIGGAVDRLSDLIRKEFPAFSADMGKAFEGIGKSIDGVLAGLGTSLGQLGAGAQIGSAVGDIGTSIFGGNKKGAQAGGAIGGAIGSAFGPIGTMIGSVLGSTVGALIKGKNNFADVMLSATGPGSVFNQRGGAESQKAGLALGTEFSQTLNAIATVLGGKVGGGQNFGSIGFSGEEFYFNAMGGDFKAAGNQRFASAEAAVAAAIKNAVTKGAFEGLTESSKALVEKLAGLGADEILKVLEQITAARNALADAYNREAAAIGATIEKFAGFTANLESFRASLAEQLMTAEEIYQAARVRFDEISAAAIKGNEDAIAQLVGVSQNYLNAAANFLTPEEYNREIENVMKAVDLAIVQTKTMEEYAQSQLDALNASVEGLITLDQSVLSVADAIKNLQGILTSIATRAAESYVNPAYAQGDAYAGTGGTPPPFANGGMHSGGLRMVGENGPEIEATGASRIYNANQTSDILSGGLTTANQISALRDEMRASLYAIAKNTGRTANQLVRWDGDGLPEARNY